jgi:hypothetical protein
MGDMYCGRCHRFGIFWVGLGGMNEHTYCPYCHGTNCQQVEEEECIHEISDNAGRCTACGEVINEEDK